MLVAMSGGVDSSVAASRLVAAGHQVVGVTLHLWGHSDECPAQESNGATEGIRDARHVCDVLGVPHHTFDRRRLFRERIVDPFVAAYLRGETPSPCIHCNRFVKIHELMGIADHLGAELVATGHYARILDGDDEPRLHRGRDLRKDQSYFLHVLTADVLRRLLLPLGDSLKAEVRAEAERLHLPVAQKGESQELCFVPSGRYDALIEREAQGRTRPGPIVKEDGTVVGQHAGVHRFTIGQRRNLGVALGQRAYVVAIEPETATVRLGSRAGLLSQQAELDGVTLATDAVLPLECEAVVRYGGRCHPATVLQSPRGAVEVHFREPVSAVVPGQFAVFYRGDRVLGGGRICRARSNGA